MKKLNSLLFPVVFVSAFLLVTDLFAATVPAGQDAGAAIRRNVEAKDQEAVSKSLGQGKKVDVQGMEQAQPAQPAAPAGAKVLVNRIVVEGVTLLKPDQVEKVTTAYQGKELSLEGFREVADKITDLYRKQGYATSFAFIRPQKIENNTLVVSVIEGKVGAIRITGNKWFKSDLLLKYVDLKRDEFFNYDSLRENVRRMNEHPDVNGRVVLSRGEAPAETDVEVQVKEHIPLHVTLGYNNYNSKYLDKNKYSLELKSTNFLGFGDIFSVEGQTGEADLYHLYSTRYLFPLTPKTSLGMYYLHVNQALGKDLEDANVKGKGDVADFYLSHRLIDKENLSLNINPGFEYKNIKNRVEGTVTSEDKIRTAKLGFDVDYSDPFRGRTIVTEEIDWGIPEIMGGSEAKSESTSRPGTGSNFVRSVTNAAYLHSLPLSTVLMLKAAGQFTNYSLPSSEQFQAGGYYTVRGYPVSELSGDTGYTGSAEWHWPLYFLPKDKMIPHTQTSWYDAFTVLGFFDYGVTSNNSPRTNEIKRETIYSAGAGLRFNVTNRAYVSLDYGFPLGQEPADGSTGQGYIETKIFF